MAGIDLRLCSEKGFAWNFIRVNEISLDLLREYKDKISWKNQLSVLQDIYNRWNEDDQKFWDEFKEGIEQCEKYWGIKFKHNMKIENYW